MDDSQIIAPFPDLRIIATRQLRPHEQHDSQRADPLIASLQTGEYLSNPPIVTPIVSDGDEDQYLVLDGANRSFAFQSLGYPHILVQVVTYDHPHVSLDVWSHIISDFPADELIREIERIPNVFIHTDEQPDLIATLATLVTLDQQPYMISVAVEDIHLHNARLCDVVNSYQRRAVLNRTTSRDLDAVLPLNPRVAALMTFPTLRPADILTAAREHAYLPPGVSRHIVQGRAIQVNFPLSILRDEVGSLGEKNEMLRTWLQRKVSNRQVRYYAEATYQFDE